MKCKYVAELFLLSILRLIETVNYCKNVKLFFARINKCINFATQIFSGERT